MGRTNYYQMNVNIGLKLKILTLVLPSIEFQLLNNHFRFVRIVKMCAIGNENENKRK